MLAPGFQTMKSVGFLFKAPLILAMLFVINLMTSPGHWWVQWAALGIGIAWFFALFRVLRDDHCGRRAGRARHLPLQPLRGRRRAGARLRRPGTAAARHSYRAAKAGMTFLTR